MLGSIAKKQAQGRMSLLVLGGALMVLAGCSSAPQTRFWEITPVEPPISPVSMQPLEGVYQTQVQQGAWVGHQGAYPLSEGSVPPPTGVATGRRYLAAPPSGGGVVAPVGAPMVQGHPVHGYQPPRMGHPDDIEASGLDGAVSAMPPRMAYGALGAGAAKSSQSASTPSVAQPAFGTMQGAIAAPDQGPGGVGSTLFDPATGQERDFRNVILNPQTMDPRNVNRQALDRLSAMSIRGYTMQATQGRGRPEVNRPTSGMTGPRAKPYWEMIADDVAEQMFSVKPPGRDFYYIEPATKFRNRVADEIFRDVLAQALRQRGAQIAPSPDYATAFVRIKVESFNLNPLGFNGNVNPPDYTPIIRDDGHMMMVLDRGLTRAKNADLTPVAAEGGYGDMVDVDPFVRPFTGIMVSGIVEERHKGVYRVHGAYYIDRKDI